MKKSDFLWLSALAAGGVFIWRRDLGWTASADDILPILAGLPLFAWLLWPIRLRPDVAAWSPRPLLGAAVLFAAGVLFNSTLALALSWTLVLWTWLDQRLVDEARPALRRLLLLPLFSFPWIALDLERLGWWFRLSGAAAVEQLLHFGNIDATRQGTFLLVNGFQLSVEPACSGLNGLQSMMIAGTMIAFITLRRSPLYWVALAALPFAAWLANVLRILSGALVPLVVGPERAQAWVGPLHSATGWLALCTMFGICWLLFSRLEHVSPGATTRLKVWARNAPWLECVILVYGFWRCFGLLRAWFTAPFDQLGWIAFALWILPIGLNARDHGLPTAGSGRWRPWCLAAGVGLIFCGDAGEVNALKHGGLALVLIGFAPRAGRLFWAACAVAWMPALGWGASRFGVEPAAAGMGRAVIAMSGCAWWLGLRKAPARYPELDYVGSLKNPV